MAKKKAASTKPAPSSELRQPAEMAFADEIDALVAADKGEIPAGWRMSPRSVLTYIVGGKAGKKTISPKSYSTKYYSIHPARTATGTRTPATATRST